MENITPNEETVKLLEEPKKNDEITPKKDNFFDPYKDLIKQTVKETWNKDKFKEIGNIQKVVRQSIKTIKENIEKQQAHINPADKKPMNLDSLRDLVIDVLANKISKKYQDEFKSLIVGDKYNIKYHVCMVFVFKSDPKLLEKYKEIQAEMDKKEKEQKGKDEGDDDDDGVLDCIFNFISRIDFKKLRNIKLSDIKNIGSDALKGVAKELGLPTNLDELTKMDLNTLLKNEKLRKMLIEKLAEMGITLPEGINFDDLSSLDINKAMQNDKLKSILKAKIDEMKIAIPQGKTIEDVLNTDKEMKSNVMKGVIKDMVLQMISGKLGISIPTSFDDLTNINLNTVLKNEMFKKILIEKLAEMGITLPEGINFDDLSSLDINKAMQNDKLKSILKAKIDEMKIAIPQGKTIEDVLNTDKEMKSNVMKGVIKDMVEQMMKDKISGKLGISIPTSFDDLTNINLNTVLKNEMFKKILTEKLAEMGITLPEGINFDDLSSLDINKAMQNDKLKSILKAKIDEMKIAIPQGKTIEDVLNTDKEMKSNVIKGMFKDMVEQMMKDKISGKLGISIPTSFDDLTNFNLNTVLKNEMFKKILTEKLAEMGITLPEAINFDDLSSLDINKAMQNDKLKSILKAKIDEMKIAIPQGKTIEDVLNTDKEMKSNVMKGVIKDMVEQMMKDKISGKLGISIPTSFDDLTNINLNTVLNNELIKEKLHEKLNEMGIVLPKGINFDDLKNIDLKKAMQNDKMNSILKEKIDELKIAVPKGKSIEDVLNSDKEMKNKVLIEVFKDMTKQMMKDQVGEIIGEKKSQVEKSKELNKNARNSGIGEEKDEFKEGRQGNEEDKKLELNIQRDSEIREKQPGKNDKQDLKNNNNTQENLRDAKNVLSDQIPGDKEKKQLTDDEIKLKQKKSLNVEGSSEKRIENEGKEQKENSQKEEQEDLDDPKSGVENILDEKKQQLLAAAEEEKKKLMDIAEEQKKKLMEEVEEQKQEAFKKLNEMNPMNNIKAGLEEQKKKMQEELAKINPMASIGDPKKLLEPGGITNAVGALKNDLGKAVDIGKNAAGNLKDSAGKTPGQGDAKLDIGAKADEMQKKAKEQMEKGKAQLKAAAGEAAKNLKNKLKELTNIKNLKKMLTINNLIEWGKKIFGMADQKKGLTERQKVIANLKFLSNIFAEIDNDGQDLLKTVIKNYIEKKSKAYEAAYPHKFKQEKDKLEKQKEKDKKKPPKNKKKDAYEEKLMNKYIMCEFDITDIVLILSRLFRFLCGISTIVKLEENEMFVKFYVKSKYIMRLAESFDYEMQLKPYAHIYDEFKKQKKILKEEEAKELAKKLCEDKSQFHQINLNNQKLISPYVPFFEDKYDKFRKYLENDDFHTCVEDEEFEFNNEWDFESSSSEEEENYEEDEEAQEAQEGQEDEAKKSKDESKNQNSLNDKISEERKDQDELVKKKEIKEDNEEEIRLKEENKEADGNKEEIPKKDENLEGEKQGEEKKPEEIKVEENKNEEAKCPNYCDIFRNIDKLRLIEKSIDELANINLIKKHPDFNDSFFLRNYFQYQKRMGEKYLVLQRWNIYSYEDQMELIQTFRNFFGEKVAFYFFWVNTFNKWLTFLAFIGAGVFVIVYYKDNINFPLTQNSHIDLISLIYLVFCVIVATWSTFFLKVWGQSEILFTYLWGMKNIEGSAPYRKEFKYDKKEDFVFDKKIPFEEGWKKAVRMTISYIIMVMMCALSILMINGIFNLDPNAKKGPSLNNSTNSSNVTIANSSSLNSSNSTGNSTGNSTDPGDIPIDELFSNPWPVIIGFLSGIQIEFMSYWFGRISRELNDWENHEKNFQFEGSMIIKIVCYEVINNYNSLMFISFFKDLTDKCNGGNCMFDLNIQVYSILTTKILAKFSEFRGVIAAKKTMKDEFKEKHKRTLKIQSLHHLREAEAYNDLIADYNEMLILFGYNVFFCSAAPLTPLFSFGITYLKKMIDSFKMFNLKKVNLIEGANGIQIYNYLFTAFYYIGLLTNVAVVLFANPNLAKLDLYWKFVIFICVENAFVIIIFIFKINTLPHWFNNTNLIENQYNRKFFMKDCNELPHHEFVEKKKPEWDEEQDSDDDLYEEDDAFDDGEYDEEEFYGDEEQEEEGYEEGQEEGQDDGEGHKDVQDPNQEEAQPVEALDEIKEDHIDPNKIEIKLDNTKENQKEKLLESDGKKK